MTQIVALVGGSEQAVLRRLQLLYHHGYLERPRAQIEYYQQGGSRALVYGLADRGAESLRQIEGSSDGPLDWSMKNRAVKRLFLEHALLISTVMVALELACRRNGQVRLLNVEEIVPPDNPHMRHRPFGWKVSIRDGVKLGVIPDRVFALEFLDQPKDRNRVYYFLEADRATMPVVRNNLRQTSFQRKLLAYEATWTQELHHKHFGFHRFRVLTVTTSTERLGHLIDISRQLKGGQGLFLFTDVKSLLSASDPIALPWQGVRAGQTAHLFEV
jgi:DNA-binding Lrp family transcriptional regulator